MGLFMSVCLLFIHIVTTMTFGQTVATVTSDTISALLTLRPVMWRKEHLWKIRVLWDTAPCSLVEVD
jgi:hypothetical protein